MGSDEEAVRETHAAWIAAVNRGDLASLLRLMTDDVVFLNPGRPPLGREEFSDAFSGAHREFRLCCLSDPLEVAVVGALAYALCRDSLSLASRAGGDDARLAGHRMTIYRRHDDGRWLLARDAHTLAPAPAAES